ncbi:coiled-coil domain-containing protein 158 isoform X1 [Kryptolebias marmoratus]|uniref:coiled-coil domain-containing protein 158 isoform X1 n=2 Tax=Kryptolebias marmoratus TaxID=37003 RepID=UPI000D530F7D|nr:coiled-coil domain-containing protein 158 isoform X1 [Kryptolebias marmoratus]
MQVIMTSGFQLSEPQSFGLAVDEGFSSTEAETQRTSVRLRFNSLTLDELSKELDRRTEETQKLQEEVENATKEALKRFGCTNEKKSPGQSCPSNDSSEDSPMFSAHQQAVTQPPVCSLDTLKQKVVQRNSRSSEKTHDQPEQQTFSPQRAILNLQNKLCELQMEKDVLSDLRLKDSRTHVDQVEKMLSVLEELQNIKRSADWKLQESEDEAQELYRKVESLERFVREVYQTLCEKHCGDAPISTNAAKSQAQVVYEIKDLNKLQKRRFSGSEEHNGVNQQESSDVNRIEDLITSLGQEVAMLTDKLSSSKDSGVGLCVTVDLLKKLAERQTSLHHRHISELQSAISSYKDKICCLEQKILDAQTRFFNAQREREQSLQHARDLQSNLCQLKQQLDLCEDSKVLAGQLEVAREQLFKAREEKTCLQTLLEQKAQEVRKSQDLLQKKEEELHFRQQQTQQHLVSFKDAQSRCQTLQAEQETLRMKLNDGEKMINVLRLQIESSVRTAERHRDTIDNLQQENGLLIKQLNQHKLEIQQLRAELARHESNLASVEGERRKLRSSVAEQSQRVREEALEKDQVAAQLELQRVQFINLTKEHKELQRLHSCRNGEHEGVVLKLQSQLINARDELDKIRRTLSTLQGVDGHGLQVALDMQKEITARREQVDSLRGRIQQLEEKVERLQQEKRSQSLETHRQLQELTFIREEKRQLANELKALRSKDQQLRERIGELEAILRKMSESFANCQDFLQVREQEYFRLKLRHALDLKELQGQNLCSAPAVSPPDVDSQPSSAHTANIRIKSKKQRESSTCELRSVIRDPRGVTSEYRRPHADERAAGCSFHRRRSAPADSHESVKSCSRLRRKTCGSEMLSLKTSGPSEQIINRESFSILSPSKFSSFPQILSLGRKSPVHTLLTSDPVGQHKTQKCEAASVCLCAV